MIRCADGVDQWKYTRRRFCMPSALTSLKVSCAELAPGRVRPVTRAGSRSWCPFMFFCAHRITHLAPSLVQHNGNHRADEFLWGDQGPENSRVRYWSPLPPSAICCTTPLLFQADSAAVAIIQWHRDRIFKSHASVGDAVDYSVILADGTAAENVDAMAPIRTKYGMNVPIDLSMSTTCFWPCSGSGKRITQTPPLSASILYPLQRSWRQLKPSPKRCHGDSWQTEPSLLFF